jgi:hypothetical protein
VLPQPRLVASGPRGLQGLDDRGGHALVEHAAQELLAGCQPRFAVEHLDAGAQGPEQGRVAGSPGPAGQHRDVQPATGHRGHHRDIGERDARVGREAGQLTLGAGRGGVQVGPQDIGPWLPAGEQAGQPGLERLHRRLRAVNAQHELRLARGLGLAGGVEDGFGRRDRRVVAADPCPRSGQVASDDGTGLPQAEHRDDQRLPVPGHHARGWSAARRAPPSGSAGPGGGPPALAFALPGRLPEVLAD